MFNIFNQTAQLKKVTAIPETFQGAEYVKELKRRPKIIDSYYGFDPGYEQDLKELLRERK